MAGWLIARVHVQSNPWVSRGKNTFCPQHHIIKGNKKIMRRHSYRRGKHKNRTGSVFITMVIYGLFIYLIIALFNISINKSIRQNVVGAVVKKMAANDIGLIGYVSEKDKKIISDTNDNMAIFVLKILSDPVSEYNEKSVAVNIADNHQIEFFLDNKNLGIDINEETGSHENNIEVRNDIQNKDESDGENQTGSGNEEKGGGDNNTGNDQSDKSDEQNNDIENQDTDTQGEQNVADANQENNSENSNSENTAKTSNMNLNKTRDIQVSDMTYEYLMKNFYTVVSSTTLNPEDINAEKLMSIDMKLSTKSDQPQILIYHTHGQEGFSDSISGNPETGIVGVGNYLVDILREQYGYNVIHITDSFDYVNGVFDRSKAYDYAYEKIASVLAENPSIEVVIDLHRDGVGEHTHLVTEVNGKPTAQIMFFNGISRLNGIGEIGYLYNPYRTENLAMSLQMKVLAEEYFEGFTRRNYIQAYQYNLHMRPKSMLIEAGAQTNSFEEVKNAMEPLAAILHMCIGDAD